MAVIATLEAKLPQPIDPYFPRAPVGHRIVVDSTSVLARIRPTLERDMRWYFSLTFEPRGTEDTTDGARVATPRRNAHQDNLLGLATQAHAPISSSPSMSHKKPGLTLTLPIRSEKPRCITQQQA